MNHSGVTVAVLISLLPSDAGGLKAPMPAGTRSLLLKFPVIADDKLSDITLGAAITPQDKQQLSPGATDLAADVVFWAEEAPDHASPGSTFQIWYSGRIVGTGKVLPWSAMSRPNPSER